MIASLNGVIGSVDEDGAIIDVGGVGYLVFASARTLAAIPAAGAVARLLIETHVREDHIHLYGFADAMERDWFRLLTTVQGVGARVALAILSALSPDDLARAIIAQDKAAITQADGVGPKLATRILTELEDRAGGYGAALGGALGIAVSIAPGAKVGTAGMAPSPEGDALSALVNLGYGRGEALGAIVGAARRIGPDASAEALIKAGLQELAS